MAKAARQGFIGDMLPITEQQAAASAHSGLHGSAKMENPTKAITATLRTIVAIAASSIVESRLDAMRHQWRQSSGSVDLGQAECGDIAAFACLGHRGGRCACCAKS